MQWLGEEKAISTLILGLASSATASETTDPVLQAIPPQHTISNMVKLYVCALIALALFGATSQSAFAAADGGAVRNGVEERAGGDGPEAWVASASLRALRQAADPAVGLEEPTDAPGIANEWASDEPTEDPTLGDDSSLGYDEPTEDPSLANNEPTEDPTLGGDEPTEDPALGGGEPTQDPALGGDEPTEDPGLGGGQSTEDPALSGSNEPTEDPALGVDGPTEGPTVSGGEPTIGPTNGNGDASLTVEPSLPTSPPSTTTVVPLTPVPATLTTVPSPVASVSTTATNAPALVAPVCTAKPQRGDQLAGVDIVTDASCLYGGLGCLGTVCRFCKRWDSAASKHLAACDSVVSTPTTSSPSSATPVPVPQTTTQTDAQCGSWLSTGDRAVGVLIALDRTCSTGAVGCVTTDCRYCRAWETPQSRHMKACSLFSSVVTTTPPSISSFAPSAGAVCENLLSSGDRAVGISVVSDDKCAYGGLGCIGSSCRYCRVKDTPLSKHLMQCSGFPSTPTLAPTVPPTPAPTTAATAAASGECVSYSTKGDRAVGIFVALDETCARGGVGCIRTTSCRYCRKQDTTQSHHLKECSQFSVVVLSPSTESSSVVSTSFSTASKAETASKNDATGLGTGAQIVMATACAVGALAVAAFVVKRFSGEQHDVELTTPANTFISHRSVSISAI